MISHEDIRALGGRSGPWVVDHDDIRALGGRSVMMISGPWVVNQS